MIPQKQQTSTNNTIVFPNCKCKPPKNLTVAKNGTVDAITNREDLLIIKNHLLNNTGKYGLRNWTIFAVNCNLGLRTGDLVRLQLRDLLISIEPLEFREYIELIEEKTSNTRTQRRSRKLWINENVKNYIGEYLSTRNNITLEDYLFPSQKYNHISRNSYGNLLKKMQYNIGDKLSKKYNICTHTTRKSFGRNYYDETTKVTDGINYDALNQLSEVFGHSSTQITRKYLGWRDEDIKQVYLETKGIMV